MNLERESQKCLQRIIERLSETETKTKLSGKFEQRLRQHFGRLFELYLHVYGDKYDFFYHIEQLVKTLIEGFSARSTSLKQKDTRRLKDPLWYRSNKMLGMSFYVDLFGNDLAGLIERIPYLKSLGITYVHLMPLFLSPQGDNDGGYAVSDYRTVNPVLGTTADLKVVTEAYSKAGISVVLDFVFNHTSDEHQWAEAAKNGDDIYQNYYYMFDNKDIPNHYEQSLREIFPQVRRGNFTFNEESKKWVWTTFNNFQWDLNYSNPEVFNAVCAEMLYLANLGCEGLRLDALAFIWKEMGTNCENQPNAHKLIQCFNTCLQIVAPSVVFKSEAIVHPDEVIKYIDKDECQLSYNPLLMALLWNSLATRKTRLLTESMQKSFAISEQCAWINYVRCHDDIGWTFDDHVAASLGIHGHDHRYFLNQFYTGRFEGSFANGVAFAENPATGDCRVCGSLASLAGLEKAIAANDQIAVGVAINRIMLLNAVILSIGGIPVLFAGDELGLLNDYSYLEDPAKSHDDRWVHRLSLNDSQLLESKDSTSSKHKILMRTKQLINIRKQNPLFGAAKTHILQINHPHLFCYKREDEEGNEFFAICNFSEHQQHLDMNIINQGKSNGYIDLISRKNFTYDLVSLPLDGYQVYWLQTIPNN